jgi:hypothetical protein
VKIPPGDVGGVTMKNTGMLPDTGRLMSVEVVEIVIDDVNVTGTPETTGVDPACAIVAAASVTAAAINVVFIINPQFLNRLKARPRSTTNVFSPVSWS